LAAYATHLYERLPVLAAPAAAAQVAQAEDAYRNACFRLQQRWFEIRQSSPRTHRDKLTDGSGELLCVYGTYLAALARFVDYRNRLPPPTPEPLSFEEVRRQYKALKRERARQAEAAATHWHPMEIDRVAPDPPDPA
jgi:hypothetical protein